MQLETKFELGQDVWIIKNNKVIRDKISEVIVTVKSSHFANQDNSLSIEYRIGGVKECGEIVPFYVEESNVFNTKEDLIESW